MLKRLLIGLVLLVIAFVIVVALQPDDYVLSTHRGHGHCLAKGAAVNRMFAELLGKEPGYCRGKGGSMHIADPETGNLGANAIVGGSAGIATGAALSAKMRGTGQVAVCFFGDGALGQGLLYESMNMASLWKLPVIYICENNLYGEYTPASETVAGGRRRLRQRLRTMVLSQARKLFCPSWTNRGISRTSTTKTSCTKSAVSSSDSPNRRHQEYSSGV